jgi:hypothetical protein
MHAANPARRRVCAVCLLPLGLALVLAGCGGPKLRTGAEANPSAARGLLVAASSQGEPVPLVIDTVPPSYPAGPAEIAGTATAAAAWLGARFTPVTQLAAESDRRRLVFRFEDVPRNPELICSASPPRGGLPPAPVRLYAVFCDGARPVADVDGTAAGTASTDAVELVTTTVNRLFPGDGSGYYAFPGVSLGVGIGSGGGWGLGGGLRF